MRIDEIADSGFFWLPQDVDAKHRIPGTLRVSALGAVTLETFSLLDAEPNSLGSVSMAGESQGARRILGVTKEHGFVTLDGCLHTGSNLHAKANGGSFSTSNYWATWLFVGVLYEPKENVHFSRVTFKVEGLDEWLALSGIQVDGDARQGQATITFLTPKPINLPELRDGEDGKIGFGYSIPSAWEETKEAQVSQNAYVELSTDDWWTADEATRRVMWFRDFLRLASDQSVAVTGLTGYSRDATEPAYGGGEREREIEIVCEERDQGIAERNLFGPLMLFRRSDLNDELQVCLARWFEMYSQHHQPFRLYFSAVDSSRDSTLEEKFRQLTEAIETLDKALYGKARRDLRKRVRRLAEPFADHLGNKESCKEFGEKVARTRNVVVHHVTIGDDDIPEGPDLLRLTYQCELLLIYHFVAVVTGSSSSAIEMVKDKEALAKRLRVVVDR